MDIQEQVRQLLARGCRISAEYADARRFRTQSWSSCPAIESTRLGDVMAALERCCQEHEGMYVRLLGVDTQAKRRVLEQVVQRPGQAVSKLSSANSASTSRNSYAAASKPIGSLSGSVESIVSQILSQGLSIGLETADKRRFRAKSWTSAGLLNATSTSSAMRSVQACLEEHQGEFVRLLGVDRNAKKRIVEEIIQRPNGSAPVTNVSPSSTASSYRSSSSASSSSARLSSELVEQVRQALSKGYRIGTEHADKRRFRTKSWQSCGLIEATSESGVLSALNSCLVEHAGEYVRILIVDPKAKKRILEEVVQRPGRQSATPTSAAARSSGSYASSNHGSNGSNGSNGNGYSNGRSSGIDPAVKRQIQDLLSQGYKIGLEYADKRRFRAKSWQTVQVAGEALSSVAACLQDHSGDYVKLIGVDAKAKRRVFEEIVQRPS